MRLAVLALLVGCIVPEDGPDAASSPTDTPAPVATVDLSLVGYNVESGDAVATTVAERIVEVTGEAIWGFSEVESQGWMEVFANAAEDDDSQSFEVILGTTGNSDRLGIAYDTRRLSYVSHEELDSINRGNGRAPLVAHFTVQGTDQALLFMVNHLWRSNDVYRHEQARDLNRWAADQTLPVIAVGDYNFDWSVDNGDADHDAGYDLMTENGVWSWVRPAELHMTQCNYSYEAVLDFVFVAGAAQTWAGDSTILATQNIHCQDNASKSDHRPVQARFAVPETR